MSETKGLSKPQITKIQDYLGKLHNIVNTVTVNPETKAGENYSSFKDLLTDVNSEIKQTGNSIWQASQGLNPAQATRYSKVLSVIKGQMKTAEYAHLDAISAGDEMKEGLGTYLKNIDQKYGEEINPLNSIKKIFGIDKEVGEKGFKEADQAVNSILSPSNTEKLNTAMQYLDNGGKESLGKAIISKIIDASATSTTTKGIKTLDNIKIGQLSNNMEKYRDQLTSVLGQDKMNQFDDWLTGAKKARLQNVNITDELNTSGTGFVAAVQSMLRLGTEMGIGSGLLTHNPITGLAVAGATMGVPAAAGNIAAKLAVGKKVLPDILKNKTLGQLGLNQILRGQNGSY
jgi:hypothetical protein